jgi:2'-5' RNA ligase
MVEDIWDELEDKFGVNAIRITPYPHFSWQIGEEYDVLSLKQSLEEIALNQPAFTVQTTGLGLFSGEKPVLFIAVVKSPELMAFHRRIWDALLPITNGAHPYYSPQNWVPHISIVYEDLTAENIGGILKLLSFRPYYWEFQVENLSFIYEPAGVCGTLQVNIPLRRN